MVNVRSHTGTAHPRPMMANVGSALFYCVLFLIPLIFGPTADGEGTCTPVVSILTNTGCGQLMGGETELSNQPGGTVNREILTLIRASASMVDVAVLKSISAIFEPLCLIWIPDAMRLQHGARNDAYYKYCC